MPGLLQELKLLLGDTYDPFDGAMRFVDLGDHGDPSSVTGSMGFACMEAMFSVNRGARLAVAVTVGELNEKGFISVFSTPRVKGLAELPKVKSWVEEFQKNCGKWEVILR